MEAARQPLEIRSGRASPAGTGQAPSPPSTITTALPARIPSGGERCALRAFQLKIGKGGGQVGRGHLQGEQADLYQLSFTYDDMAIVKKMKEIVPEYKSQHSKYSELDHN